MKKDTQPYDERFFDSQKDLSYLSAKVTLPQLFKIFKPNSVVDVGCGMGGWLAAAIENGISDVLGIDGDYVEKSRLFIESDKFLPADLGQPIRIDRRFDLAMSLEVAEHLTPSRALGFVSDLTSLADVVLFSAALPGQTGTAHINENWLEYWALLFRNFGFVAYDPIRPNICTRQQVDHIYLQNIVLFVKSASPVAALIPAEYLAANRPISYVLPHMYLHSIHHSKASSSEKLKSDLGYYYALCQAYITGARIDPSSPGIKYYGSGSSLY